MVDLKDYLNPVSIEKPLFEELAGPAVFSHNVAVHTENNPIGDITKYRVAIIGVPESRNSHNTGSSKGPDAIRNSLYRLARIPGKTRIIDLGNMKNGITFNDTVAGLSDVIAYLLSKNIFPLLIGGSSSVVPAVDRAFQSLKTRYIMTSIDSRIDFHPDRKEPDSFNYLNNIIYGTRSHLDHFVNIGYQTYLNDQQTINRLLKRGADLVRIGDVRTGIHLMEPLLRDSNVAILDIASVRQSDSQGTLSPSPNGFYGEEICLLSRYAGISDNLKVFGLFEVNPELDIRSQTTGLAAQIIWFFLEGFSQKQHESPGTGESAPGRFIKYHVRVTDLEDDLVFIKSNLTDRWWMELSKEDGSPYYAACSHEDYLRANRNEVPDRWMKAATRIK